MGLKLQQRPQHPLRRLPLAWRQRRQARQQPLWCRWCEAQQCTREGYPRNAGHLTSSNTSRHSCLTLARSGQLIHLA